MQEYLSEHRGFAVLTDLYLDRLIYASLIAAALGAGTFLNSL